MSAEANAQILVWEVQVWEVSFRFNDCQIPGEQLSEEMKDKTKKKKEKSLTEQTRGNTRSIREDNFGFVHFRPMLRR